MTSTRRPEAVTKWHQSWYRYACARFQRMNGLPSSKRRTTITRSGTGRIATNSGRMPRRGDKRTLTIPKTGTRRIPISPRPPPQRGTKRMRNGLRLRPLLGGKLIGRGSRPEPPRCGRRIRSFIRRGPQHGINRTRPTKTTGTRRIRIELKHQGPKANTTTELPWLPAAALLPELNGAHSWTGSTGDAFAAARSRTR